MRREVLSRPKETKTEKQGEKEKEDSGGGARRKKGERKGGEEEARAGKEAEREKS